MHNRNFVLDLLLFFDYLSATGPHLFASQLKHDGGPLARFVTEAR